MPSRNTDTVSFTSKGQIVIPSWLRKEFNIQDGTRAVVVSTPEGILLKPVTSTLVHNGRGIVKARMGPAKVAEMVESQRKLDH
jgi:AbrB family looped-hinge helix DNA binding protein